MLIALNTVISGATLNYVVTTEHRITALEAQVAWLREDTLDKLPPDLKRAVLEAERAERAKSGRKLADEDERLKGQIARDEQAVAEAEQEPLAVVEASQDAGRARFGQRKGRRGALREGPGDQSVDG